MTAPSGQPDPQRRSRFETFEDRLVLSGQPVEMFSLDPLESPELQQQYELAPALDSVNLSTQVAGLANRYGLTGAGQTVAVIDSGIAYDHVALGGGYGNRVVGGWDFAEGDADPYDDGPAGFHGTHVAGIIGSDDATYQGVAPGADLVALRVFNDAGQGNFSWVEQALRWVHDHKGSFENPITTVNLSLGTNWNSTNVPNWAMLEDEFRLLEEDGIFISVAAGNSFQSYQTPGLSYPAASPYVVPVASHGANGQLSSFSQRASNVLVAPGESIMSTAPEHLWGSSAQSHRFIAASGTSMAAPYVAGASVLVREAMDMIGYQNVNQDMIEGHLRATADIIHDAVTNANYYRVNLQRALDSLMSDDYGDTLADAEDLGTLVDTDTVHGYLHSATDADAFSFVAGSAGRVSVTVSPAGGFTPRMTIPGVSFVQSGSTYSFDVEAGQRYSFILDSSSGSGTYALDLELESVPWSDPPSDLGTIQQSTFSSLQVNGERWLQLQAGKTGWLTLEASASDLGSNFRIELYDDDLNLVRAKDSARFDSWVTEGENYLVRLVGQSNDLDLKATNLLALNGRSMSISGTDGDDAIKVHSGYTVVLDIGGTEYRFWQGSINSIQVSGSAGNDMLDMVGDGRRDMFWLRPENSTWRSGSFTLNTDSIEHVRAHSGGGSDALWIWGTAGDDSLVANSRGVTLTTSTGVILEATRPTFTVYGEGGHDTATLEGSTGSDRVYMNQDLTRLYGYGFGQWLHKFSDITIDATQGGRDYLYLYDSVGSDQITLGDRSASMTGGTYSMSATGFHYNLVYAGRGGGDTVQMYDTDNSDRYTINSRYALLQSSTTYNYAYGFRDVTATSTGLGVDTATVYDTWGDEVLEASLDRSTLTGNGRVSSVEGFDRVSVYSSRGNDRAVFTDSAGDDRFYVNPSFASLSGSGKVVESHRFNDVSAVATNGGLDTASLVGSNYVDQLTTSANNTVQLGNRGYTLTTSGFGSVNVDGRGGRDVAVLDNLAATETLFARGDVASVSYGDRQTDLKGFAQVRAVIEDEDAERDVDAVDFVFNELAAE